ncbi:XisI protein [Thiothrix fructosivorans]|uniref:XisI protein n=1 Tax=Thiothrix fructosivorans TaxID=111770 RepID=A0A8B0SFJ9_9GAMM|nr:XisI protein [Thiothrix fructosivorans]MBO0615037.1 XisI protein [Thiothrix fructosivorans]QTX09834.1 XisI protein [Thiothrix fructosivorans]
METPVAFYQRCIKQVLSEYGTLKTDDSETQLIFDDERMHYLVMWLGWRGHKRIHECAIHIDIVKDQIVIQWNDTEELLDETLMDMGVPKTAICLGTIPPEFRDAPLMEDAPQYQEAA